MLLRTIRRDTQELLGRTIAVRLSVGLLQHSSPYTRIEKKSPWTYVLPQQQLYPYPDTTTKAHVAVGIHSRRIGTMHGNPMPQACCARGEHGLTPTIVPRAAVCDSEVPRRTQA